MNAEQGILDTRRRRLDEIFADQPFLSVTMRASRIHEEADDSWSVPAAGVPQEVMTLAEAAVLLRVSPSTIRTWMCSKRLPHAKLGNRLRFRRSILLAWLEGED